MRKKKNSFFSILIMIVLIVSLYYSGNLAYDLFLSKQIEGIPAFSDTSSYYGFISPKVVHGFTEEPLKDATVVIPELNQSYRTGEDGCTAVIRVPITEDEHFKKVLPKTWGEITLIVYKEGYIEQVLFNIHVWENQTRDGPTVLLFPQNDDDRAEPYAIIESPHRLWIKELVEKYRSN